MSLLKKLPRNGRWQMHDPRFFGALQGGKGCPFGALYVDFKHSSGHVLHWGKQGSLTTIKKTGGRKFTADFSIGSRSGGLSADLADDGLLSLNMTGWVKMKTDARLTGFNYDGKIALLTCISNGTSASTPGHSALIVDNITYTFQEVVGAWLQSGSGWKTPTTVSYLKQPDNVKRPIVIQELSRNKVNVGKVMAYLNSSIVRDDDYLASGVCSSQTANAIDRGTPSYFNSFGPDTPHDIYALVRKHKLASREYVIWDKTKTPSADVPALAKKLVTDYNNAAPAKRPDVRDWQSSP